MPSVYSSSLVPVLQIISNMCVFFFVFLFFLKKTTYAIDTGVIPEKWKLQRMIKTTLILEACPSALIGEERRIKSKITLSTDILSNLFSTAILPRWCL